MFICLCTGVTSQVVHELVARGAATTKDIARACGAGMDCGRCRHTVRVTVSAAKANSCKAHGGRAAGTDRQVPTITGCVGWSA